MKYLIIALMLMASISARTVHAQKYKKYAFKTGKVVYQLEGNTKGTQTLYWDDYGCKEVSIENSVTKMMGQKTENNKTTLTIGTDIYSWTENGDNVTKTDNPIVEIWTENNYDDEDVEEFSIDILESLGYEKIGSETVCGKKCDVWKGLGKTWVWKGLSLKTEVKLLGTKSIITATDVDTNIKIASSHFDLPAGKEVLTADQQIKQSMEESGEGNDEDAEQISKDMDEAKEMLKGLFGGGK